jgi:hypothetical protein
MTEASKSIGQLLQNWLIRNNVSVIDPLFVPAVDHAFENAVRDQSQVKRRDTSAARGKIR